MILRIWVGAIGIVLLFGLLTIWSWLSPVDASGPAESSLPRSGPTA